jgi:hypothetical protein
MEHFLLKAFLATAACVAAIGLLTFLGRKSLLFRFLIRLTVLTRYSILVGLLLPGLIPLAKYAAAPLMANLFVMDGPWELFHVTWLSLIVAAMVLVTFRVTQSNAPARFRDYEAAIELLVASGLKPRPARPHWSHWRYRWLLLLLMGLPVPLYCVYSTLAGQAQAGAWGPAFGYGLALVSGIVAAVALLATASAVQQWLLDPATVSPGLLPFERRFEWLHRRRPYLMNWLGEALARSLSVFGPGYARAPTAKHPTWALEPGHGQALLCLGFILAVYLGNYWLVIHSMLVAGGWAGGALLWVPALFYVLVLLLLVGFFLCGLAFLLDYFRFPVVLVLLLGSALLYTMNHTDHFYDLDPAAPAGPTRPGVGAPPRLAGVFTSATWEHRRDRQGKRTLVVVTASGGGIQATAWTARVLTGLHERYGPRFTRSIGLISAVSGGSVGTMYYLANWKLGPDSVDPLDAPGIARINANATASSLEAAAWGVAFPDLLRMAFPPWVHRGVDRGWALEQTWRQRLRRPEDPEPLSDLRLTDWMTPTRAEHLPVVVFNATLVETGQRLLISPVLADGLKPSDATTAREFLQLYPESHLRVSTAARLSATFPYISPMARPLERPGGLDGPYYHVADGGYVDNEGAFTAMDWILHLLNAQAEDPSHVPFDRVLVVRILPFPTATDIPPAELNAGWLYETLGPISAMLKVRTASQAERNRLALDIFARATKAQTEKNRQKFSAMVQQERARLDRLKRQGAQPAEQSAAEGQVATLAQKLTAVRDIDVTSLRFTFERKLHPDYVAPLSWRLTEDQKRQINDAWGDIVDDPDPQSELHKLDAFFQPR